MFHKIISYGYAVTQFDYTPVNGLCGITSPTSSTSDQTMAYNFMIKPTDAIDTINSQHIDRISSSMNSNGYICEASGKTSFGI